MKIRDMSTRTWVVAPFSQVRSTKIEQRRRRFLIVGTQAPQPGDARGPRLRPAAEDGEGEVTPLPRRSREQASWKTSAAHWRSFLRRLFAAKRP